MAAGQVMQGASDVEGEREVLLYEVGGAVRAVTSPGSIWRPAVSVLPSCSMFYNVVISRHQVKAGPGSVGPV